MRFGKVLLRVRILLFQAMRLLHSIRSRQLEVGAMENNHFS